MKLIFTYSYNFKPIEKPIEFEKLPEEIKAAINKAEKEKLRFFDILCFDVENINSSQKEIETMTLSINALLQSKKETKHLKLHDFFYNYIINEGQKIKQIHSREKYQLCAVCVLNESYTL